MPISGLDYLSPVRAFRNFFGRYGTTSGAIRGIWNAVIPVAVVDRYRDDSEGSLFGMTMYVTPLANQFPAFAAGSVDDDWELVSVSYGADVASNYYYTVLNVYTPDYTYLPVENPVPGLWEPGLNTDWAFTLGSVRGVSGSNTALPARMGFQVCGFSSLPSTSAYVGYQMHPATIFDPPIRVYRDVTLGFIIDVYAANLGGTYVVSILYRIRPRTTDGPRTGAP